MENKNKKIIFGILLIILIGIVGYIYYSNTKDIFKNKINIEESTNIESISETKETLLEENETIKYINYIPYETNSKYYECTWNNNNNNECNDYKIWIDAYTNDSVNIYDISDNLLLNMGINNTKEINNINKDEICNDDNICGYENQSFYNANEVIDNIYKMYNKKIEPKDFNRLGGAKYYNNYFIINNNVGNYPSEKVNKIKKATINNDEITIYERVLFIYDTLSAKNNIAVITNKTNYTDNNIVKTYSNDSDNINKTIEAKELLDKGNLYKHIFKYNKDTNNYYWYSTNLVKD